MTYQVPGIMYIMSPLKQNAFLTQVQNLPDHMCRIPPQQNALVAQVQNLC